LPEFFSLILFSYKIGGGGRRCGLPKEQVVVRSWRAKEFGKRVDRALEAIGRSYMRDLNKKLLAMKFTIRILQYY
jgi:hypothetical protein